MLNDPNTITTDTTNYYAFGWISFITVFVFNISFIIIMIYDIIRGFRKSNRQFIIEARQNYFFKLIKAY